MFFLLASPPPTPPPPRCPLCDQKRPCISFSLVAPSPRRSGMKCYLGSDPRLVHRFQRMTSSNGGWGLSNLPHGSSQGHDIAIDADSLVALGTRNAVVFDNTPPNTKDLLNTIRSEARSWATTGAAGLRNGLGLVG
jgi:hypothetical protein